MNKSDALKGLYLITPPLPDLNSDSAMAILERKTQSALEGGASVLQYRDKLSSSESKYRTAIRLKQLCHQYGAIFIINDDVELCAHVGADGVHLGKTDGSLQAARSRLGRQAIIGISCYNQLELALQAEQAGADYVAFGRFFPSKTKPHAVLAEMDLLRQAARSMGVPVTAIGGITVDNAPQLIQAGARMLAVIEGVYGHNNTRSAAAALCSCFTDFADVPAGQNG